MPLSEQSLLFDPSVTSGTCMGSACVEALRYQAGVIADFQKGVLNDKPLTSEEDTGGCDRAFENPNAAAHEHVADMPLVWQGPAAYAWELLVNSKCSDEQIDATAIVVRNLHKQWQQRADQSSAMLPAVTRSHSSRVIWLGGGGCGKSYVINKVLRPLALAFFGPDGYLAQCQSNAGARLLRGRTIHSSLGLAASSSLTTVALRLTGQRKIKLERTLPKIGALVLDEVSQVSGELLHANALSFTYARQEVHGLRPPEYMAPDNLFGGLPLALLAGDFLQLPPIPSSSSLLFRHPTSSYEHKQGRAIAQSFSTVFQFKETQRFTDPLLVQILASMREPGGRRISEEAWSALCRTKVNVVDGIQDARLRATGDWMETGYQWSIVSLAQQLRSRLAAAKSGKVLYYIQAIDRPAHSCAKEDYTAMLMTPSMTETKKLMGLLPVFVGQRVRLVTTIMAPELVPEREGTVVGIELRAADKAENMSAERLAACHKTGCCVCSHMPEAVYVKIHDFEMSLLPEQAGSARGGIVAIKPHTATWKFKRGRKGAERSGIEVQRTQIPLAPAHVKTLHSLQGTTAEPGLVAHWGLPKQLTKDAVWLARYVLLSRIRSLSALLSYNLPDREAFESGPPEIILSMMDELCSPDRTATSEDCKRAREELGWPSRR